MDVKKYISSGILEQYVLGLVSEKDRRVIEQYMSQYPEIRQEVDAIEGALELYAEGSKMKVSPGIEKSILDRIDKTPREVPVSPVASSSGNALMYLMAALLAGTIILSWWLYSQSQNSKEQLETQQNELQQLLVDCNEKDQEIDKLNDQIEVLIDTGNQQMNMKGTAKAPEAVASVFYNSDNKKSYLNIGSLPEPPSGKQYQLWALVDGNPVDMGVFDINQDSENVLIEVPFIENAGIFAVTLETMGGNPTPNLEELYAISS